jgi:hypothetical protein
MRMGEGILRSHFWSSDAILELRMWTIEEGEELQGYGQFKGLQVGILG